MEIQGRPALLRPLLVVTGICAVFSGPAYAQEGAAEGKSAEMLEEVVVTGLRASMQSAQDIKRQAGQIGIYEKGPLAIRAAYNWRSDWVRTTAGNGTGNLPILTTASGSSTRRSPTTSWKESR